MISALILLLAPALAEPVDAVETELRGSIRSRFAVTSAVAGEDGNLELRFRPELRVKIRDGLSAALALRAERYRGATEATLGEADLELDRAYFDLALGKWDLRLGRQAISFGQALIWNPVDLVDSNTALDFNIVKNGVDAVRAAYAVSPTTSVLGIAAFPEDGTILLLRLETLAGSADVGVLAARDTRREETVYGFDVKGDVHVGYWAEGAFHDRDAGDDFLRLVLGVDYSLPLAQSFYFAFQVYYDGSGGTGVDDYDFLGLVRGERRFLARRYASWVSTLTLSEVTSWNASFLLNLEDRSWLLTAGVVRYFFENLEVTLRTSVFRGSGPGEWNPVAPSPLAGRQPSEVFELYLEWHF